MKNKQHVVAQPSHAMPCHAKANPHGIALTAKRRSKMVKTIEFVTQKIFEKCTLIATAVGIDTQRRIAASYVQ